MTLGTTGVLNINGLSGTGNRFLQADLAGNVFPWTGSTLMQNSILFGDGTWKPNLISVDGTNMNIPIGSRFGIGVSAPNVELDVHGRGAFSSDLNIGGIINLSNSFKMEAIQPTSTTPMIFRIGANSTPSHGPVFPVFTYHAPCNIWYTNTTITNNGPPYSIPWTPPTANVYTDLMQVYNTSQTSVLSMGVFNGDGIIALEPFQGTPPASQMLKLNPGCANDVEICAGGGATHIVNSADIGGGLVVNYNASLASTGGLVSIGNRGATTWSGAQVDMLINSTCTKAITVKDPSSPATNKNIFQVAKTGGVILGTNVQSGTNDMLTVGQSSKTDLALSLTDNTNSTNQPFFKVYGSGYTEIDVFQPSAMPLGGGTAPRAFSIKDLSVNPTTNGKDLFVVLTTGKVYAREIEINLNTLFPDYVFSPDYKLKPIKELESYIFNNKHLPGFENSAFYEKNGLNVNDILVKQQEKVEELTLYIIQLEKRLSEIEKSK